MIVAKATAAPHELARRRRHAPGDDAPQRPLRARRASRPRCRRSSQVIEKVADTPSTVLITGESGTGKELVARALHERLAARGQARSSRSTAPRFPRRCSSASCSATRRARSPARSATKPGRFELADGGTLFLDEIGEIPLELQAKLLRVLQEREFERVGGTKTIKVDVRVVAATNRDLEQPRSRTGASARISTTGSTSSRIAPAAAARARATTSRCSSQHFLAKFNARLKKQVDGHRAARRSTRSGATPGRATSASSRTCIERAILFCEGRR